MRSLPLVGLAGSINFVLLAVTPAPAQTTASPPDGRGTAAAPQNAARPLYGGSAAQIGANGAPIVLEVNKGTLIRLTAPAATVFIASPDIADVQVKSPTLIYVSAKSPGETVLYAVDASDSVLLNSPVRVEHDISRLRSSLRVLAPGQSIAADSVDGNLVLSGMVSDPGQAEKVQKLAAAVANETKGSQVINRMTVATPNQVNLHVRVAEVSLTALSAIGVNWHKFGSNLIINTNNPTDIMGVIGSNEIIIGRVASQAITATIDALAQEGFITDLAQPDLVALNGQTASFLAGGGGLTGPGGFRLD